MLDNKSEEKWPLTTSTKVKGSQGSFIFFKRTIVAVPSADNGSFAPTVLAFPENTMYNQILIYRNAEFRMPNAELGERIATPVCGLVRDDTVFGTFRSKAGAFGIDSFVIARP